MPKATVNAVLFDMDETLLDHTADMVQLGEETYEQFKDYLEGVPPDKFMRTVWQKANDLWQMMFDGVITGGVARPYTFKNALRAFNADDSIAEPMMEFFEQRMLATTRPAPGAFDAIAALRGEGIVVGIVTNGYTCAQTRKIEHHGLDEAVDFYLVSEAAGFHKPDRRIFEMALERAKTSADHALFVGDNVSADIAGAAGAGIASVLIDPKGERRRKLEQESNGVTPTHTIQHLEEVLPLAGVGRKAAKAR